MSESKKDQIVNNLQQAKQTGELKTEKIKEIIKTAVSEAILEAKEGRQEISSLVKDAIAAVVTTFQDKKEEIQEGVTASIEGAVEGISAARRKQIDSSQTEIKTLEAKVETEENELQREIDAVLDDVKEKSKGESTDLKETIFTAVEQVKNSEEVALLQKRYAQLKAQLAIVKANLAGRYGESFENVDQYLSEAKNWYERAKDNPEVFTGKIEEKQLEFEQKLGDTGKAIAQREKKVKLLLKELWKSIAEIFRDK